MGDRGMIHLVDTGVWLYAHTAATRLPDIVAAALAREQRWNDPEYLARIIFQEMIGDDRSALSYGIGTEPHGDTWRHVHVDCGALTVSVEDHGRTVEHTNFAGFVDRHTPDDPWIWGKVADR